MQEIAKIAESIQNPPDTFRVGDKVVITKPEFVSRVGYPLSHEAACEKVKETMLPSIRTMLEETGLYQTKSCMGSFHLLDWPPSNNRCYRPFNRLISALASFLLEKENFGGPVRSIHTFRDDRYLGVIAEVLNKKVVKTGIYDAPYSYTSYEGEHDYYPGGLTDMKTHILLELNLGMASYTPRACQHNGYYWIERCNVRKVANGL